MVKRAVGDGFTVGRKSCVLFIYTDVWYKMMSIVEQLLPHLKLGKANINFLEQIAIEHQIESVPCLLVCDGGKVTEKIYAFQSVPFLYELLKKSID